MFISKELVGIIAVILVLIAYIPYIRDILRKTVSPHPYSWLVWALSTFAIFFLQLAGGSGSGAYMTLTVAIIASLIFILAMKNSQTKIKPIDIICLIIACAGIAIWLFIDAPLLSIVVLASVEVIGFIPTLIKGWEKPYEDSATLWGLNSLRQITGLLAVQNYNIITMFNPVLWILIGTTFCIVLLHRRIKVRKPKDRKRKFRPHI
jgi:hypothetical protein